jgi:hypothetical protein
MDIKVSCVICFEGATPSQFERLQSTAKAYGSRTIETPNALRVMFDNHGSYLAFLDYAVHLTEEWDQRNLQLDYFN